MYRQAGMLVFFLYMFMQEYGKMREKRDCKTKKLSANLPQNHSQIARKFAKNAPKALPEIAEFLSGFYYFFVKNLILKMIKSPLNIIKFLTKKL